MSDPLLVVDHLTKRFGGVTAVNECSFSVEEGVNNGAHRAEWIG